MKKNRIYKNYILNMLYQILVLIAPFVTMPYISRILGTDKLGEFSYMDSIAAFFVLFANLGIATYGQKEISYHQDSREKRTEIFWNIKILQMITSAFVLIVYVVFSLCQENSILYMLFAFDILAIMFDVTWLYQGLEEFAIIVGRSIFFKIAAIVYIFMFVHDNNDLLKYILGYALTYFLNNFSMWIGISRFIGKPDLKKIKIFNNLGEILLLFIPTIAIQISTYLDKTMLGIITGNMIENGYYEQATKICRMVMTLVTSLSTVMIPRIGNCFARKDTHTINALMQMGYRFVFMLGVPLCVGLIVVSPDFVPWFFGPGYEKTVPLIQILSFLIIAIGINNMTGMQYLVPTGRQNMYSVTVIAGAIINIVLNSILIPKYLSAGAAAASVTAEVCIAIFQLIAVRHELSVTGILKNAYKYIVSGLIMYILLKAEKNILLYDQGAVTSIILMVTTGAVVYFVLLLIIKDEFFCGMCRSVCIRIKTKLHF